MPTVYIPTLLQPLTGGKAFVEVEGATVSQAIDSLERSCPGLRDRLVEDGRLRSNLAVAVDGEITPDGLLESVEPSSEIHFIAAIKGGALLLLALCLMVPVQAATDFTRDVHPILAAKCFGCHSGDKRSGGLALDSYGDLLKGGRSGAAVIPGEGKFSLLLQRVSGEVAPQMPLAGPKLLPAEIATLRNWIDDGARSAPNAAPAPKPWIAPMALHAPAQSLEQILAPYCKSAPVSDRIFARRVYLDLWGITPPPDDLAAFLADRAPDKRAKLVSTLLAGNDEYAEHWISFWNDLLRNDEGVVYYGARKSITKWLLDALETNKPYNRMVAELLNPTAPGDPDGFLIGVNWRGDVSASQVPAMQAAQNSAQVFLGINLKCNSCHDSFISRWKLADAYGLAAYFSADPKLELYRCDKPTGQFAAPRFLYPDLDSSAAIPISLADRHAAAARLFTAPADGRLPRTLVNRIWQRLIGRGIVEPVDDMDAEPWSPALLDWLAADFVAHAYDIRHLIATIMTSRAYQMPAVEPAQKYVFRGPEIRRLTAEQFADTLSAITGEWRMIVPNDGSKAEYVREWRAIASPLTRALGRPNREQVFTERNNDATMLQGLELVNGETINHALLRGAQRMLGQLQPAPAALWDSGQMQNKRPVATFTTEISNARELWFVISDRGSYTPERVLIDWHDVHLLSPSGATPLASLAPKQSKHGLSVYDIAGKGFTRIEGKIEIEKKCMTSEINPQVRAFIFDREPDFERLVSPWQEMPLPAPDKAADLAQLIDRIFEQALSRPPTEDEHRLAAPALNPPTATGLADLIWSVAMLPEFQMIR